MSQVYDETIAVLHGSANNTLSWVWLSSKHGKESIANVAKDGYWVRDHFNRPDFDHIVVQVQDAWAELRAGRDVSHLATHYLVPPHHNDIAPIPELVSAA